jgi:hypothetical protein
LLNLQDGWGEGVGVLRVAKWQGGKVAEGAEAGCIRRPLGLQGGGGWLAWVRGRCQGGTLKRWLQVADLIGEERGGGGGPSPLAGRGMGFGLGAAGRLGIKPPAAGEGGRMASMRGFGWWGCARCHVRQGPETRDRKGRDRGTGGTKGSFDFAQDRLRDPSAVLGAGPRADVTTHGRWWGREHPSPVSKCERPGAPPATDLAQARLAPPGHPAPGQNRIQEEPVCGSFSCWFQLQR